MTRLAVVFSLWAVACGGPVGDGDGVVDDTTSSRVGWTALVEGTAHDVGGVAVVVDEATIEVRDFTYDGGGINARFFLVVDGGSFSDQLELTGNLVGSPSDGDTLTLPIPSDATNELWDAITLWCLPAGVSFGFGAFAPPADG